jgi:hypothetical protein
MNPMKNGKFVLIIHKYCHDGVICSTWMAMFKYLHTFVSI